MFSWLKILLSFAFHLLTRNSQQQTRYSGRVRRLTNAGLSKPKRTDILPTAAVLSDEIRRPVKRSEMAWIEVQDDCLEIVDNLVLCGDTVEFSSPKSPYVLKAAWTRHFQARPAFLAPIACYFVAFTMAFVLAAAVCISQLSHHLLVREWTIESSGAINMSLVAIMFAIAALGTGFFTGVIARAARENRARAWLLAYGRKRSAKRASGLRGGSRK